jgi:predicted nucleic acid-binding protein
LEKIVLDTNILIEILKSNDEIVAKLKKQNAKLYTLNTKDFRFIDGLTLL